MELKRGYRQTDVGVIPDDWEIKSLAELTTLLTNGFVGKATSHYTEADDGVTYIQGFNVEENTFNLTGIKKITREFHNRNAKSHLREGDLLTIQTGDVGLTTIVPKELEGANCHALIISRFKKDKAHSKFFVQYFNSSFCRQRLKNIETGTTMKHLNVTDMLEFQVPLPSRLEQEAIAEALSDADALIESLEQLITKKRHIKQGAMQALLTGKKRLPGFSGEWEVKRLGDVASFYSGGTPPTDNAAYYGGEISWITSSDLNKGFIDAVEGRITKLGFENSSAKMVNANTLLIALYGATAGVVAITQIPAAINQAVLAIIPTTDDYLFLFYKLQFLKNWIINTYTQGGQPNLSGEIVKAIELTMPSLAEQTAIAAVLSDMDAEITALEGRLVKARHIKQGMMQALLTGRIRLNHDLPD